MLFTDNKRLVKLAEVYHTGFFPGLLRTLNSS